MDVEVQTRLDEISPVYREVQQLRAEWDALQTVEQARAEYGELLRGEDEEIERWETRKAQLEREARLRANAGVKKRSYLKDEGGDDVPTPTPSPAPTPTPAKRKNPTEERRRLQNMASRFGYYWRLDDATRARINRIAEDEDRPLGEAIALLDWSAFKTQLRTSDVVYESEAEHSERLDGWKRDLTDYLEILKGDINALKNRYGEWLMHVWKVWRARGESAEGQTRWETLIAQKRQSNGDKLADLKEAVAALEAGAAKAGGGAAARKEQT